MEDKSTLLSWKVLEYDETQRSNDWFWGVGLLALLVAVISFMYANYMFGIMIILGIATLMYFNVRPPQEVSVIINSRGIKIQEQLFVYQRIKHFWVEAEKRHGKMRHLFVMTDRFFMPMVAIPLPDTINHDTIRETLLSYLPEKEMTESPAYDIMEKLGF